MSDTQVRTQLYFEAVDGMEHAPDGPGWYLLVTRPTGPGPASPIVHKRLSNEEAVKLFKVLDKFAETSDNLLERLSENAIEQAKKTIQSQIDDAEHAIERLERLRLRAAEFGISAES
jgi:hypothetical protein